MNVVKFPAFNLELNFSQIAFNIGEILIYKYAVCIVLGIILGLILCKISKEKYDNKFENVLDIFLYAMIFGILGARLYFVLFNLKYYLNNPMQILNIRDGGLAIYGGLITGFITTYIICKIKK